MSTNSEELKVELAYLKGLNQELFEKNVLPAIHAKIEEFMDAFEDFFRERGFVVRRKNDSVRVSFDILHFKAFSNENQTILITKGKEQIALIPVKYKGNDGIKNSREAASISQLEKEIEREKQLSLELKEPEVYYTGGELGPRFDDPFPILNSIFNV
ncbi:hypothetical protein [Neobacillus mesonae]|uniref:hypothetical protein n=1 Tax=Neobacillus mesonae TaxID=1193713 RepID=UPI0020414E40|nr:hypothetical protein [Neobacillus mesonae]MCM3570401.1 hypothetical protein [Neobacillus mesonae]